MARRRYLIAYDIAHPRRLRVTCKIMEGYGDRLQYSVSVSYTHLTLPTSDLV